MAKNQSELIKDLIDKIADVGGVITTITATGADLPITAASGKDIVITLGANDTSKKLSIKDSDTVEVLKIDGNGLITSAAGLAGPVTGTLTGNVAGVETVTAKTAKDLTLVADGDEDVIIKMGDASAANKVSFQDSAAAEVASIDSNGLLTATGIVAPLKYAHSDTDGAPTNTECISAFGAAAAVGAGFVGVYQDDHASGVSYLCISNGTNYDTIAATAAA